MKTNRDVPTYSIGTASDLTALTHRQIRYYEQQGLISPARSIGNQRLYSDNDLEKLKIIKLLLKQGVKLKSLKENWKEILKNFNACQTTNKQNTNVLNLFSAEIDRDLSQFFTKETVFPLYYIRNHEEIWRKLNK